MGVAPGKQDDALEEARLAGRVGTPDELRTGAEGRLERAVSPEIGEAERGERGGPYDVVRTGITTWT
ncbi:MAG: hypothetical protein EPO36_13810 [Chloroflexota bacterium]|nr:MAG: hypothetical protein EPO36_13810 [Chloroflexota bacterium]